MTTGGGKERIVGEVVALAAASWFFMVPPLGNKPPPPGATLNYRVQPDKDAPLSAWSVQGTYESEQECRDAALGQFKIANEQTDKTTALQLAMGDCFAGDDPRLRK